MTVVISDVPIEVSRKDIKQLHLYVKPPDGAVFISAPQNISDGAIELFARTKIGWIRRQREKFQAQPRQSPRENVSGESVWLFGRQYFLRIEHRPGKGSVRIQGSNVILSVRDGASLEYRSKVITEWHREMLKNEAARLLPKVEQYTGIKCSEWCIKDMRTKWGTCSVNARRIWLNLKLSRVPLRCLEYVILHELVHLRDRTHGKVFTALMDRHMPYWREARAELNAQVL